MIEAFSVLINKKNIRKLIDLQFVQTNEFELFLSDYLMNDLEKFYNGTASYLNLKPIDDEFISLIIKDLILLILTNQSPARF